MRVHVVHAENRHLYERELDAFFRERHRIYVDEKQWRDPATSGLEIDQFDTDDAVYLVGLEDDRVITGSRLIPTTGPTLVSEAFPQLSNLNGIVRAPDVAEWTRGFIAPEFRERGVGPLKGQFCAAVMEYCLAEGIAWVGGLQDLYWLRLWKQFGWTVVPTGTPERVAGKKCVVAYMEVSEAARNGAAQSANMTNSILVRRGAHRPFVSAAVRNNPTSGHSSRWLPTRSVMLTAVRTGDQLIYIRDILRELTTMADSSKRPLLRYLLEMAYIEASDTIRLERPFETSGDYRAPRKLASRTA